MIFSDSTIFNVIAFASGARPRSIRDGLLTAAKFERPLLSQLNFRSFAIVRDRDADVLSLPNHKCRASFSVHEQLA
jgi:hypothetical protein